MQFAQKLRRLLTGENEIVFDEDDELMKVCAWAPLGQALISTPYTGLTCKNQEAVAVRDILKQ